MTIWFVTLRGVINQGKHKAMNGGDRGASDTVMKTIRNDQGKLENKTKDISAKHDCLDSKKSRNDRSALLGSYLLA